MIAGMAPEILPGRFVFVADFDIETSAETFFGAHGMFREPEGISLILEAGLAERLGFAVELPMRQITLTVQSALDGIGLTAAVSTALAREGIACNVVAAARHDHIFVPEALAYAALAVLQRLQASEGRAECT